MEITKFYHDFFRETWQITCGISNVNTVIVEVEFERFKIDRTREETWRQKSKFAVEHDTPLSKRQRTETHARRERNWLEPRLVLRFYTSEWIPPYNSAMRTYLRTTELATRIYVSSWFNVFAWPSTISNSSLSHPN